MHDQALQQMQYQNLQDEQPLCRFVLLVSKHDSMSFHHPLIYKFHFLLQHCRGCLLHRIQHKLHLDPKAQSQSNQSMKLVDHQIPISI